MLVALSQAWRKCFSTTWPITSDSSAASPSVSIRNQVFEPGASQMYCIPDQRGSAAKVSRGYATRSEQRKGIAHQASRGLFGRPRQTKPLERHSRALAGTVNLTPLLALCGA